MPIGGSLTLGDVAARTPLLAVDCSRCDRAGRYSLTLLSDRYGLDYTIPTLLIELSKDCPRRLSLTVYDRCGCRCPELSQLFLPKPA